MNWGTGNQRHSKWAWLAVKKRIIYTIITFDSNQIHTIIYVNQSTMQKRYFCSMYASCQNGHDYIGIHDFDYMCLRNNVNNHAGSCIIISLKNEISGVRLNQTFLA